MNDGDYWMYGDIDAYAAVVEICQFRPCQRDYMPAESSASEPGIYCSRDCERSAAGEEIPADGPPPELGVRPPDPEPVANPLAHEIMPTPGSRNGWSFSIWERIGRAEVTAPVPDTRHGDVTHRLYGVYGVRHAEHGAEVFTQFEGYRLADGSTLGRSLLASSMDSDPYVWGPASWFSEIRVFVTDPREVRP
jgi:hypothetical protein